MIEWLAGEKEPTKFWFSTLEETILLSNLVLRAKARWRIERDYQELNDELGLDHFEGRGWQGFHHRATLCIATCAFLMAERANFSPLGPRTSASIVKTPALPGDFRPRGASPRSEGTCRTLWKDDSLEPAKSGTIGVDATENIHRFVQNAARCLPPPCL